MPIFSKRKSYQQSGRHPLEEAKCLKYIPMLITILILLSIAESQPISKLDLLLPAANASESSDFSSCLTHPHLQALRSKELQQIYNDDQSDYRKELESHSDQPIDVKKLKKMGDNDLKRRKRVGEIFGEGCFQKAADYVAAAMVYQHGDVADHFFQAFIWSKEAVKLGATDEKSFVAMTLDRYLVRIGHKQLFGSQASKANLNSNCWCLEPVEDTFPDSMREEYRGKDLATSAAWIKRLNGANDCQQTYCSTDLKPSPEGSVVGFW